MRPKARGGSIQSSLYARAMRFVAATLAVLTLAALAAGCGSGSYTKRDFVARADAICASTLQQTRAISPPSFSHSAEQQLSALAGYLANVVPHVQSEADQLRALRRPTQDARDRAALARYLGALARAIVDYRELAAAAKRGDAQGVASAETALRSSPVASLAASYGLDSCAAPGTIAV